MRIRFSFFLPHCAVTHPARCLCLMGPFHAKGPLQTFGLTDSGVIDRKPIFLPITVYFRDVQKVISISKKKKERRQKDKTNAASLCWWLHLAAWTYGFEGSLIFRYKRI